jgi:hypothetical protein
MVLRQKGIVMDASQTPLTMRHDTSQPFGPAPPVEQKVINLALQGGGAHVAALTVLSRGVSSTGCLTTLELRLMG